MKLIELQGKQQALERMRRDFVANVSHELRTPLTVLHGYLEALLTRAKKSKFTNETYKKIFTEMYEQTTRMENIIADLLLLSKLETGDEEIPLNEMVNISQLLKAVLKDAKTISGAAGHKFFLNVTDTLKLKGNKNELRSMISNLIFNAVKYTPPKGKIIINWFTDKKNAYLQVSDTGIGIAKKHIPRLTERFYRVDKARSRRSGGTGLGLAIVKHVLIHHNGKLKIESKLGKGSTFTCVFPFCAAGAKCSNSSG